MSAPWFVYMIVADDNSLYTGITTDIDKRFLAHQQKKGAKYFYARRPLKVVYQETHSDRASASRREYEIKQLTAQAKWRLIEQAGVK